MKGITPIISIIILLLVTVGLAAAAWTYMSNYLTTLTAKTVEIPTQKCVNGEDVMAIVHNMGTSKITMANDVTILDDTGGSVTGTWTEVGSPTIIADIDPGGYGKVTIVGCCVGAACPKTCTYSFVVAGRSQTVTVYCPGA